MEYKKPIKNCIKCKEQKELIEFYKHPHTKDGYLGTCKICCNKHNKNQYKNNKEYFIEYRKENKEKSKEYYLNNFKKTKEYYKKYHLENKNKRNNNEKNRKLIDPLYKLSCNIRTLICISIKGNGFTKKSKTCEYLGCSFEEFKKHIENKFSENMNWENRKEWHLDHIYPVSLAKDEQHLIKLNHYTNFQPLWAIDNIKKGNKII